MAVSEREFWTALKPFFDLIGLDPYRTLDWPDFYWDDLSIIHVLWHEVVVPDEPAKNWPKVPYPNGDGEFAEWWAYVVDREMTPESGFNLAELWPGDPKLGMKYHAEEATDE